MKPARRVISAIVSAATLLACVVCLPCLACKDDVNAPAEEVKFTVDFPNVQAAAEADVVQVFVFDATSASRAFCSELISTRTTGNTWSKAPLATDDFTTCELLSRPNSVVLPPVDFGPRAVVVVAQSAGKDLLIGCQRTTIGEANLDLTVSLIAVTHATPALTKCQTLQEHCEGRCPR